MNPKSKLLQNYSAIGWKYQWDLRGKRIVQDYRTTLTLFKYEEEKVAKSIPKGAKLTTYYSIVYMAPFIYYVSTFFGILDPLPYVSMFFITESKQKLAFSDPPTPYKCLRNIWMVPLSGIASKLGRSKKFDKIAMI